MQLTASRRALPGLKATVLLALIFTGWPVCGFFPVRAPRWRCRKESQTDQGHAVLAVQRAGDFIQQGVENAIGLFLGEIGLFGDSGG